MCWRSMCRIAHGDRRIVVSDPESVQNIFLERAVPFSVCDLVVVELKDGATELGRLLAALLAAECNIFAAMLCSPARAGARRSPCTSRTTSAPSRCSSRTSFVILGQSDISR